MLVVVIYNAAALKVTRVSLKNISRALGRECTAELKRQVESSSFLVNGWGCRISHLVLISIARNAEMHTFLAIGRGP